MEECGLEKRHAIIACEGAEIGEFLVAKGKVAEVVDGIFEAACDAKSALERLAPVKEMKNRFLGFASRLPVAISHGQLVEICEERPASMVVKMVGSHRRVEIGRRGSAY
jgi:hypothetical protein